MARWVKGVPRYGASLTTYRRYVVNHEVGHRLGHGHERCPGRGRPAPVMQQQTLGLHGCTANASPYREGRAVTRAGRRVHRRDPASRAGPSGLNGPGEPAVVARATTSGNTADAGAARPAYHAGPGIPSSRGGSEDGRPARRFALGVDLGTSNTVAVLRWPDGRTRPLLFDGQPVLPSGVLRSTTDGPAARRPGRPAPGAGRPGALRAEPEAPHRRADRAARRPRGRRRPTCSPRCSAAVARAAVEAVGLPAAGRAHLPGRLGRRAAGEVLADALTRAGWPRGRHPCRPGRRHPAAAEPVAAARYFTRRAAPPGPGRRSRSRCSTSAAARSTSRSCATRAPTLGRLASSGRRRWRGRPRRPGPRRRAGRPPRPS